MTTKNIILFAGSLPKRRITAVKNFNKKHSQDYRVALIRDSSRKILKHHKGADIIITCDLSSEIAVKNALKPYVSDIIAATCDGDDSVPSLQKIIPHLPYINTPTIPSLKWSIDKTIMRSHLDSYDENLSPRSLKISNTSKNTLTEIQTAIRYPVIIKPINLAASSLVQKCDDDSSLKKAFQTIKKNVKNIQQKNHREERSEALVEEFMDGEMYSIDGYVSEKGAVKLCPIVHVKTGRSIGFDDFFGYLRTTPTDLPPEEIQRAEEVATSAIYALSLRSCSAHIELILTQRGWKIVELGPRIGGARDVLYKKSFNIDHLMNDILNRIPIKFSIPRKVLQHTAIFYFFSKKEGHLLKIRGLIKITKLESYLSHTIHKKKGEFCAYAKNGGTDVLILRLSHKNKDTLEKEIKTAEELIIIETS